MNIYLPSCNFTATFPEASRKIKDYLLQKPDVRVAGCCRPTQKSLTSEDTVLSLCFTCSAITAEVNPDTAQESIWEYLLHDVQFPWADFGGERMTLQDCWRARNKPPVLDAVRECMYRMNIEIEESEERREACRFDGVWLLNPVAPKNLKIAPQYFGQIQRNDLTLLSEEEQKAQMELWCGQYRTERVVTYCTACYKGAVLGGAKAVHLMELVTKNLP